MGKKNMKDPVPYDLPPTSLPGHLKEQIRSPYSTRETICMIENPREVHKMKAQEDKGDMDVGWDITIEDVERLRKFLTPTIHTLPNLEPLVQPYMPLGLVYDKEKIVREEEQDYDIPLHDGMMQPLTPQIDGVFLNITRIAKKANGNHVNDVQELSNIKTYDCETFIRKLLHQVPAARRQISRPSRLVIMW
ncbi:hypothetical protein Tco_1167168 [Tanacetum coccineum]